MSSTKIIWHIPLESSGKEISHFIDEYFSMLTCAPSNTSAFRSQNILKKLLELISPPFTIVRETNHVDRSYSESFYAFHSSKHIIQKRFCERLSFFLGKIHEEDFINEKLHDELQNRFIGCAVIHPTTGNIIGHTLFNPFMLNLNYKHAFIRLSDFEVDIRGVRFHIRSFPYRMQDMEVTTCAEVTLLNILEYYGNRYEDYRNLQIDALVKIIEKNSVERVLPSHGLSYSVMTRAMAEAGFSPRLYSGSIYEGQQSNILNILFYYVESGLPVGVAVFKNDPNTVRESVGHSMVCIGHGNARRNPDKYIEKRVDDTDFHYVNAADYYDEYIVMDDNEIPFSITNFSSAQTASNLNVMVPLYKRMFMEATDAYTIARMIITNSPISIDKIVNDNYRHIGSKDSPLVLRLFLASSKSYKSHKMSLTGVEHQTVKSILFDLPLPRFIWICECYEQSEFEKSIDTAETPLACGEVILDATANSVSPRDCILMIHYPEYITYRYPDQEWQVIFESIKNFKITNWKRFPGFSKNLSEITQ